MTINFCMWTKTWRCWYILIKLLADRYMVNLIEKYLHFLLWLCHKLRFILSRNLSNIFLRQLMYHSYSYLPFAIIIIIFKHLTSVFLTNMYTTTLTISTSLVLYLYRDIRKIRWMNEWMNSICQLMIILII
jgi:hypothetical protein